MQQFDSGMLFYCYDYALYKRLKQARIPYITKAYSMEGRVFWQYFRSEEVNKVIRQYTNISNLDN